MYFIVETEEQLSKLPKKPSCFVKLITNNDSYHPMVSRPCLVYYNDGDKGYVLCVKHSESFSIGFDKVKQFVESHETVYVLDKKFHSYFFDHSVLVDANFSLLDSGMEIPKYDCDAFTKKDLYVKFGEDERINEIVPISKHYESAECLYEIVKGRLEIVTELPFYDDLCEAYRYVESQGLGAKRYYEEYFSIKNPSFFERDGVIYSNYNLYNFTVRPTNAFNGLNFLSIPKTKEARSYLLPKRDFFVEFDFDGYHPRIIANMIGHPLSKEPLHVQLGKQYFSKEELTKEEYEQSKILTFRQLYGGVEEEYRHIEFLSKIEQYVNEQYDAYRKQGHYQLPSGRILRRSREINKLKLFNYIVQNYETVNNVLVIKSIREYLEGKPSQLVLVAYDAFLLDFDVSDGQPTLIEVKRILERNNMVVKHKHSRTYHFE